MARDTQSRWVVLQHDPVEQRWQEQAHTQLDGWLLARARLRPAFQASKSPVLAMVLGEMTQHRSLLGEAALGGLLIGVLGLVSSLYSMQIYDRVIPSNAMQTLLVLSLGVVLTIVLEWLARVARSRLYERLIDAVDARLARAVYLRLLAVRLDQLPPSVGSLAAQTRGYETVRGFLTQMAGSLLVDVPFALIFLALLGLIGGPLMLVPLLFFVVAVCLAVSASGRLTESAKAGAAAGFFKTGLLVETIEGAETLKSGQGGWRMLGRWLSVTSRARDAEQSGRRTSEHFQHAMQTFQQLCYALLIALGAWRVGHGEMSMGALVACSILAGRVLSPVSMLVGQMLQWSHARAALQALDRLWEMEDDHAGQEPVLLERLRGQYRFERARFSYGQRTALDVPALEIRAGERVGVVGPIGSGKTTLLRLLSGLYKPQEGRVMLEDVDLALLSKPVLAEHMGYLQQEGRLFAGSLRENLLLGMVDPGDSALLEAARRTGLLAAVIAPHPQGFQQTIHEGGAGLSGGSASSSTSPACCCASPASGCSTSPRRRSMDKPNARSCSCWPRWCGPATPSCWSPTSLSCCGWWIA
jgi:ATP-binding cassette subfamily C protein LapB